MAKFPLDIIPHFDLDRLNSLLQDFYDLTKIRITVADAQFRELTAYPDPFTSFCKLMHESSKGHQACKECDRKACIIAANRQSSYTYRCHAGMTESITPIYLEKMLAGYLFFGQILSYDTYEEAWEEIKMLCEPYHLDEETLKQACLEQPLLGKKFIASASHILQAVASYLCLEQIISLGRQELPVQIDRYITDHLAEELDVRTLCRHFGIGKNQLYEISAGNYGTGIAEHIRTLRIERAKELLKKQPELSLMEVAMQCGFKDYNYFITLFKKLTGYPPRKYAKLF